MRCPGRGGGSALDPEVVTQLIGHQRRADPLARLTAREREVLGAHGEGRTNRGVARRLFLTERTVETHVAGDHDEARPRDRRGGPPPRARGDHLPRGAA